MDKPDVKIERLGAPTFHEFKQSSSDFTCCDGHHIYPGNCLTEGQWCLCGRAQFSVPKSLTDNDVANLEKIALLRAYAGKLRAAIQTVHATLFVAREECGITPLEESIYVTLSRALETPVPEDGR